MDKDRLKKMARDDRYISGIYNYCDRWCERCIQTSRCLNYAFSEEEFTDASARDMDNETYWKKMSEILQATHDLLSEMADASGIDLNEHDLDQYRSEEQSIRERAENHKVCRAAKKYINMADDWLDGVKDFIGGDRETGPNQELIMGKAEEIATDSLKDALEVICWYQHQIYVKLMRAAAGLIREEADIFNELDRHALDSDGSAKVALIGIDRSIAAWVIINRFFSPLHNKGIPVIMIHLDKLRKGIERDFPEARGFIRPGFDRVDLNS
jgi:hypothetical protein